MAVPDGDQVADTASCEQLFEVFAVLGKRWNGLIIGLLLAGPARFGELERTIPGIRAPMLSRRLTELAEAGLVERIVDSRPPVAVSYRLTELGEGLRPAIRELMIWGQTAVPAGAVRRSADGGSAVGAQPASRSG